ncbi:MAG: CDP-alcohol phosphatidyltransferase family protein [Gammaproteobacteria bacterium]
MRANDIPNIITVFRFLLVTPVVWAMLNDRFGLALLLFGVAGLSDAVDGYLAKRNNWTSRLGALMDPLADKLLLVCTFITLGWLGWIPAWLVGLVILRDLVILTGASVYHVRIERITMEPSMVSKLNTFTQIMLVLAVMFSRGIHALPHLLIDVLLYSVLITTVWSGVGYVWTWGHRALRRRPS